MKGLDFGWKVTFHKVFFRTIWFPPPLNPPIFISKIFVQRLCQSSMIKLEVLFTIFCVIEMPLP